MKKIIFICLVGLSSLVYAQALDPLVAYKNEIAKIKDLDKLYELANKELEAKNFPKHEIVLERLINLRPFNPDLKFALVKAFALQDKKTEAYNQLIEMQKAGLSYPIGDKEGFDLIKGTKVFDYIEENMAINGQPFGEGKTAFEVSHNYSGMLFENLTYDEKAERFLLGSVRSGDIYQY